jgi:branched-chain amino acid transport system substrate-binding protein
MSTPGRKVAALALVCGLLAGCGGSDEEARIPSGPLVVYSSLPEHGISATAAQAVSAGQRLALADAHERAGGRRVRLVRLDSSNPDGPVWDPARVNANAERAADDPNAVAYVGELDYGASAVSLPITNDEGILQVSPGDGLTSLTRAPPGRPRAGPERYYPTDERTFLRLTPNDLRLAERMLERARAGGARRAAVLFDNDIYGRELTAQLSARGRRDGPEPVEAVELRGDATSIPGIVRELAEERPDTVLYAGVAGPLTAPLLAEIRRRLPGVIVVGTGGLMARRTQLSEAPERVEALNAVTPASRVPRAGARLLRRVAARFGPARARPEALYGYESMRVVLDAVRSGGPRRAEVVKAALAPRERRSPLGPYEVRATGDVGADRFALYRVEHGRFVLQGVTP